MKAVIYEEKGKLSLGERPVPRILEKTDAIVRVTLASICTSDLHIKHGAVLKAKPGVVVGHEMVGVVESVGDGVKKFRPGDRVTVNVETFCGECFFCKRGYVNNCTNENGGWALGCRIDGGQAEYVRVPMADQGLNHIPEELGREAWRDQAGGHGGSPGSRPHGNVRHDVREAVQSQTYCSSGFGRRKAKAGKAGGLGRCDGSA